MRSPPASRKWIPRGDIFHLSEKGGNIKIYETVVKETGRQERGNIEIYETVIKERDISHINLNIKRKLVKPMHPVKPDLNLCMVIKEEGSSTKLKIAPKEYFLWNDSNWSVLRPGALNLYLWTSIGKYFRLPDRIKH